MANRFELGQVLSTPGAIAAANEWGESLLPYIARHARGDWGTVGKADWRANDRALREGTRLFSAYYIGDSTKVWIITEADPIMLPGEY